MTILNFVFNELGVNSFILYDSTRECIIIDPGCNKESEQNKITSAIDNYKLKPKYIINTHGHFDHIFGIAWLKSVFNIPFLLHEEDLSLIQHADKFAGIFGFNIDKLPLPDKFIKNGEKINFGESSVEIIHVPGHSPGSVCIYSKRDKFIIGGDVLFKGSIGRTDFPGGDHNLLINNIIQKLMSLPPDTVVWPGHGPKTTIKYEHDTNPFLK